MALTALDSERWEEVSYNHANGFLPGTLIEFTDPNSSFEVKAKALDDINDQIFHQTSTYEATYLVVSILVEECAQQHLDHRFLICRLAGLISLEQVPRPAALEEAEWKTYRESLKLAADKSIDLVKNDIPKDDDGVIYLVCAIATLCGERDLGWRLRHGMEEDGHECQHCKKEFQSCCYAIQSEDAKTRDDYLNFTETSMYAQPIKRFVGDQQVKPRKTFPQGSTEGWLTELCEQYGHVKCGRWLRYFFGSCACPNCQAEIELLSPGSH